MAKKNWKAIHTFVSDEARREYCTPPKEVATEKEWAELADIGLDKLINTVCYEMHRFTSFYRNSDDKRVYPPLDVDDNAELAERVHQG